MFSKILLRGLASAVAIAATTSASVAVAVPSVDFVPTSIIWNVGLDDDVSGAQSQHIQLKIKNQGNVAWHNNTSLDMGVRFAGQQLTGYMYGWEANGNYWHLGAPIAPGAEGLVMLRLPLGTLRHCQNVALTIDTARRQQTGAATIFTNDSKSLFAFKIGSNRPCVLPPLPRPME